MLTCSMRGMIEFQIQHKGETCAAICVASYMDTYTVCTVNIFPLMFMALNFLPCGLLQLVRVAFAG